ncbi:NAD(+)/NADH kinase [Candidatus Micrarchaeota archaeon]|nr:NAD(+)/NADH kinase [Candidatus Micrarchaeota archaeon]
MRCKIIRNPTKKWAEKVSKEVRNFLLKLGHSVVEKNAQITFCIGGDGTIFYTHHKGGAEGSIIGIGSDTSHICQLNAKNWKNKLPGLLKNGRNQKRITLTAKCGKKSYCAINDAVLHTRDYRLIRCTYTLGEKTTSFEGDGLIISTPTGSTAYAYSAGGVTIEGDVEAIEIVPISPYKRTVFPYIVNDKSEIRMYADRPSDFVIDGIYIKELKKNESVIIKKGRKINFLL